MRRGGTPSNQAPRRSYARFLGRFTARRALSSARLAARFERSAAFVTAGRVPAATSSIARLVAAAASSSAGRTPFAALRTWGSASESARSMAPTAPSITCLTAWPVWEAAWADDGPCLGLPHAEQKREKSASWAPQCQQYIGATREGGANQP